MNKENKDHEDGATFDMYHFFSRKDVIAAAVLIIGLLVYVLFRFMSAAHAV